MKGRRGLRDIWYGVVDMILSFDNYSSFSYSFFQDTPFTYHEFNVFSFPSEPRSRFTHTHSSSISSFRKQLPALTRRDTQQTGLEASATGKPYTGPVRLYLLCPHFQPSIKKKKGLTLIHPLNSSYNHTITSNPETTPSEPTHKRPPLSKHCFRDRPYQ